MESRVSAVCGNSWLQSRWRHQMETFSASLAICAGNSPASGGWYFYLLGICNMSSLTYLLRMSLQRLCLICFIFDITDYALMAWCASSTEPLVIGIDHDTVCAGVVGTAIRHNTSFAGRRAAACGRAGTTSAVPVWRSQPSPVLGIPP